MHPHLNGGTAPPRLLSPHAGFDAGPGEWAYASTSDSGANAPRALWKDYWHSIRRRLWLLLVFAMLVTGLAALYAITSKPVFRATATVLIEAGKAKILSIEEVYNAMSQDREYYQTQVEILRSRDVALRTAIATKLWNEPEFDPRRPDPGVGARIRRMFSSEEKAEVWTPQMLANATVGKLQAGLTVDAVRLSQLVRVSFEAQDAALAARVANAIALSYIQADGEARTKMQLGVTGLLQDRLASLRDKLLQSESALQTFREKEGLVSVSGQNVAGQQMTEIGQRLVAARVRRTELESAYQQVQRAGEGDSSAAPSLWSRSGVLEARGRVSAAAAKVMELGRTMGDEHTKVIEARAEYEMSKQLLKAQTQSAVAAMRGELMAARETERSLQTALGSARGVVQGENRQEFQLGVLEREVQANRQLYEIFLSRTKETSISTDLQAAVARVVDQAAVSTVPVRPNKSQIVGVSFALSLLLGAIVSVLLDRFKNTVHDISDAEQRLGQPVLASVPTVHDPVAGMLTRSVLDRPGSHHAKAIRSARTGIQLAGFDLTHKVMLVTSTLSGEGRTTFCTNLALAHAQTKRTLLIDCDIRHPQIGVRLGLAPEAKGLADLVLGEAEVKDCLHAVPGSPLIVLPAGNVPQNPEEMLLSNAFHEVLTSLANRVDVVIIDSPAVEDYSDALIIAQQVNNTVYLVKASETPHPRAQKGIERLQRAGASILGVVLNHMDNGGAQDTPEPAEGFPEFVPLHKRMMDAAMRAGPGRTTAA